MNVFLNDHGLFHAPGFSVLLEKNLFADEKNYTVDVILETLKALPNLEFNCSHKTKGVDACLLARATTAAIKSAGCIPRYLRWVIFMI